MSHVLVVDDEPHVCELTSRALHKVSLHCDQARDGQEAIQLARAKHYGAVATDLKMPRRHGHALVVDLLSQPKPPGVVVMTGHADPRIVHDLMGRGVEDIFLKPFDYNVLALKLLSVVERGKRCQALPPAPPGGGGQQPLVEIERALMEITGIFADSLAGVFDFDIEINEPPQAAKEFVARFAKLEAEAERDQVALLERREHVRVPCSRSATVVPVNRQFVPQAEPFMAAIRDVSEGGIRLLHTRAINAEYVALSWWAECLPYANIRVAAKVTRCQPRSPYYDISGLFVLAD